jgi:hypothetical protein
LKLSLKADRDSPREWLFLALAECRLGRPDEARKWLAKAVTWLTSNAPMEWPRRAYSWVKPLEYELLRQEVERLLNGPRK